MEDKDKTKEQLVEELNKLRKWVTKLEKSESERKRIEEKQKKTKEQHKISPEFLSDSYLNINLKGKITDCNSAFLFLTGYSKEDIVNKHFTKLPTLWLKDISRYIEIFNSARRGKFPESFEFKWIHKDGTTHWGEVYFGILRKKRRISGFNAVIREITERKRIEEKLQLHSDIMTNVSEGITLVRVSDGILLYTNPQLEKMFGYGPDELIGKHVSVLNAPPEKKAKEQVKDILNSLEKKNKWKGEIENIKKDGTLFFTFASVIKSKHHEFGDVFISAQIDISEAKRARDKLMLSEEKYRSLIETTDDLVYLVDKNCSYIFMNKKHAERFKLPFKKIIGRTYSEFHSKKQTELFKKDVNKVIRTCEALSHEHKSERDGKFYLRTFSPVKNEKGKVVAVNVISKDISELKQVENELKKSEKEIHEFAEYLQTAREKERELVAGELHDEVGQALTSLKMDIFMIKNKMSKDQKEIPGEFQKMETLLDDSIQKLRKIYSDLRPSLLEHFGIGEAIGQYVSDFQEQSGTKCTFYQNPEEIILDENRSIALYRIFQEAINNIKWHSQAAKVNVRLEEKGPNLKLTIRDNGKGIEEEQIKSSDSFGLIGMRERARFLRGELEVKGILDKGTTVKLEIPIK